MFFTYDWVKARQDEQLKAVLTEQDLKKQRPTKRSILSLIRTSLGLHSAPGTLRAQVLEEKTAA